MEEWVIAEFQRALQQQLKRLGAREGSAPGLTECCCEWDADELEPQVLSIGVEMIVMRPGGQGGGHSYKLRNLRLHPGRLFRRAINGTLTVAGCIGHPWLLPAAITSAFLSARSATAVDLTEDEATVLWALAREGHGSEGVADSGLLEVVNREREEFGLSAIDQRLVSEILTSLMTKECAEYVPRSRVQVRIVERVFLRRA